MLDRKKYIESGYIYEELFNTSEKELDHKCYVIYQCVKDMDFSLEDALNLYKVSEEDYDKYLKNK